MYRVIEGIYRNGKIIVTKFPEIEDKTKVIIAFLEHSSHTQKGASVKHDEIPLDSPRSLEDIDVTISTVDKYRSQLARAESEKRGKKILHSDFFSSPPVDLGYTDAAMLDKVIAGES